MTFSNVFLVSKVFLLLTDRTMIPEISSHTAAAQFICQCRNVQAYLDVKVHKESQGP